MFGPLPPLHQMLVAVATLAVGIASGLWIVHVTGVPALIYAGLGWGLLAGILLSVVLLHDFQHTPRPARVRRH